MAFPEKILLTSHVPDPHRLFLFSGFFVFNGSSLLSFSTLCLRFSVLFSIHQLCWIMYMPCQSVRLFSPGQPDCFTLAYEIPWNLLTFCSVYRTWNICNDATYSGFVFALCTVFRFHVIDKPSALSSASASCMILMWFYPVFDTSVHYYCYFVKQFYTFSAI